MANDWWIGNGNGYPANNVGGWNNNSNMFVYPMPDPKLGMQGVNDLIAVEPFPKTDAPTQVTKSGFTTDKRKGTLVPLKVIYGNENFPVGSIVYTKSDNTIQPWAKEVFELNDVNFILMPTSFALLRFYQPYLPSSATVGSAGGSGVGNGYTFTVLGGAGEKG
jgi:hypothetical protein